MHTTRPRGKSTRGEEAKCKDFVSSPGRPGDSRATGAGHGGTPWTQTGDRRRCHQGPADPTRHHGLPIQNVGGLRPPTQRGETPLCGHFVWGDHGVVSGRRGLGDPCACPLSVSEGCLRDLHLSPCFSQGGRGRRRNLYTLPPPLELGFTFRRKGLFAVV